jgi:AbrB family looped-hinge helix DNA binding protein
MKSTLSVKGQTVVPKEIREALGLKPGTVLTWFLKDGAISVRPLPEDPIGASMGALKHLTHGTKELLEDRKADRDKEEKAIAEDRKRWRSTS